MKLLRYIREELLVVLGTSSTEPVLPSMLFEMERLGCSKGSVGLTLPLGYSFNLDGTAIYPTLASLFLAQAMDIQLTAWQVASMMVVMLPRLATPPGDHPLIVTKEISGPTVKRTIGLIERRTVRLAPAAQRFRDMLHETWRTFGPEPATEGDAGAAQPVARSVEATEPGATSAIIAR